MNRLSLSSRLPRRRSALAALFCMAMIAVFVNLAAVVSSAKAASDNGNSLAVADPSLTELVKSGERIIIVSDEPLADEDRMVRPMGADCSAWYEVCGIVYNRSGRTLELRRDAASHFNCNPVNPDLRRFLYSGQDSNKIGNPTWPDVDCFRHNTSGCVLLYRGWLYDAGEWVRIYNSVWVYNLNC